MIKILEASGDTLIIDLDTGLTSSYTMTIVSETKTGCFIPWSIVNRNTEIGYESWGNNQLTLFFDVENIKEEKTVFVTNSRKEYVTIKIEPNKWESMDKEYIFNVSTKSVRKGTVYLRFNSTEEERDCPWYVAGSGDTIDYDITPTSGMSNERVTIKTNNLIDGEISQKITFKQDHSGLCLNVTLHHENNSVKIGNITEGC